MHKRLPNKLVPKIHHLHSSDLNFRFWISVLRKLQSCRPTTTTTASRRGALGGSFFLLSPSPQSSLSRKCRHTQFGSPRAPTHATNRPGNLFPLRQKTHKSKPQLSSKSDRSPLPTFRFLHSAKGPLSVTFANFLCIAHKDWERLSSTAPAAQCRTNLHRPVQRCRAVQAHRWLGGNQSKRWDVDRADVRCSGSAADTLKQNRSSMVPTAVLLYSYYGTEKRPTTPPTVECDKGLSGLETKHSLLPHSTTVTKDRMVQQRKVVLCEYGRHYSCLLSRLVLSC